MLILAAAVPALFQVDAVAGPEKNISRRLFSASDFMA